MSTIKVKRIYDAFSKSDGYRVLIDRLWPRGLSKKDTVIDLWLKEIAPSTDLRKWFAHDPEKWVSFQKKYKAELGRNKTVLQQIQSLMGEQHVITLLYAAKDARHNHANVLKDYLSS